MALLILGPPGTGKTTRLLKKLHDVLESGVPPERIAYFSFTRAAVRDARARAAETFNLNLKRFPYFRTIHSMCFQETGLSLRAVFARAEFRELSELTGEWLRGHFDRTVPTIGDSGDAFMFFDQYARNTLQDLRAVWSKFGHDKQVSWDRLLRFVRAYHQLMQDTNTTDFTGMLEAYCDPSHPLARPLDVDAAFVDEVQDLTPLQWMVLRRAIKHVPLVEFAGDDDQSIYTWAGADGTALLRLPGEPEVLHQSRRLPRQVHALSDKIVHRIRYRLEKQFSPRDATGTVDWVNREDQIDLRDGKPWLLLARTRGLLQRWVDVARSQGVHYSIMGENSVPAEVLARIRKHEGEREETGAPIWHEALTDIPLIDREYILNCRRNGEAVSNPDPRIRIMTIHGAKGLQAERVGMLTDFTDQVRLGMRQDQDAEMRVLYVGLTRAFDTLVLVQGQRYNFSYRF